jgi:methionine-S-sulfoxide reductase
VDGVWRTRVGYAGGEDLSPTYRRMGDHTESFQVDFDPATVSYEDLLELFWHSHDATLPAFKTQYASLILAHDDTQLGLACESAEHRSQLLGRSVTTRVELLGNFWMAEGYHQKYYLRSDRVLNAEMHALYPTDDALVNSPAAARINALLARGTCDRVERELASLCLSDAGAARLRSRCR